MIFKSRRRGERIRSCAGSGCLSLVWNLEIAVVAGQIENATKSNGAVNSDCVAFENGIDFEVALQVGEARQLQAPLESGLEFEIAVQIKKAVEFNNAVTRQDKT